jgi:hypothetical protein
MAHTTKYGNRYTDKEWAEMQAYFKAEKEKDDMISAKMNGLEKYLRRQLKEEGLSKRQEDTVTRLFRYGDYEEANIQFSSERRKAKLDGLWSRWNIAMSKLYDNAMQAEDDLEIKRLAIMEKE